MKANAFMGMGYGERSARVRSDFGGGFICQCVCIGLVGY